MAFSQFESYIVNAVNLYFQKTNQHGKAFRLKQSRFREQYVDILVDSPVKAPDNNFKYHLAIECKSVEQFRKDGSEVTTVYFSERFTIDKKGEHQIERISRFCKDCGRQGFLAVRIHSGKGKKANVHFIPWAIVDDRFASGKKGVALEEIMEYPQFRKVDGNYNLDHVI